MVRCDACDTPAHDLALRKCAKCNHWLTLCWPCSDGKDSGEIEIEHEDCEPKTP